MSRPDPLQVPQAERAVLGCVLAGTAPMADAMPLTPDEFALAPCSHTWAAMVRVNQRGQPVNDVTVCDELKAMGKLVAVGGPAWIQELVDRLAELPHLPSFAASVRNAAMARRVHTAFVSGAQDVLAGKSPAEVALAVSARLAQLGAAVQERRRTFADAMERTLDALHAIRSGTYQHYIPTGIDVWDDVLSGMERGKLEILCAYPSVGKGAVAGRICLNNAMCKRVGSLFSLEDPEIWLPKRYLADASGVPVRRLMQADRLPEHYENNIEHAVMQSMEWGQHLLIDDRSGLTAEQIAVAAHQDVTQHGAQYIVVDNASEIDVNSSDDRHDVRTAHAVRVLRNVAKTLNVPVLLLMHLKKSGNSTKEPRFLRPNTELLKNSGAFAEAARKIVALWLDEDDKHSIVGTVLKQTEGEKDIDFLMPFNASAGLVESVGGRKREGETGYTDSRNGGYQ